MKSTLKIFLLGKNYEINQLREKVQELEKQLY